MANVSEKYLWIAFFIVVIAVAAYFRFYNQSAISLSVTAAAQPSGTVYYPFQLIKVPITISNTGSVPLDGFGFGLYVNGNIISTYSVTLPAGKNTTLYYNFTPPSNGTYTIQLVGDPSMLYNIANRQEAQVSTKVHITSAQAPQPYLSLDSNALLGADNYQMTPLGYLIGTYLYTNFTAPQFILTPSPEVNNLVYPVIDVYSKYIDDIALAHGKYYNYSIVSLWIKGALAPDAVGEAAIGKGLNVTQ